LDILPYHRIGEPKWRQLGRPYKLHGVVPHTRDRVFELADIAREYGIEVTVGG
jgi:pyruvate formate lyase activating enzyme